MFDKYCVPITISSQKCQQRIQKEILATKIEFGLALLQSFVCITVLIPVEGSEKYTFNYMFTKMYIKPSLQPAWLIFFHTCLYTLVYFATHLPTVIMTTNDKTRFQYLILNERIRNLKDELNPELRYHKIVACVRHHINLRKFVHYIEEVFSNILFLEFFKSVIEICFTGFELTVSTEVEDACYMFNWDESSKTVQKMLLIMMIRAHKPLAVKAVFLKLSMATLTAILRSSYSYAAVLRSFYT
ncbi:unnamed protein product [Diabrotica balteata]|uniref:Uncharacterized protein n=1 Tax=Diabrotica balteata TaxID=107213 RepID=A0A9N9T6P0_DIABA|nr:unnamed protein product [Diabrotica balteata]